MFVNPLTAGILPELTDSRELLRLTSEELKVLIYFVWVVYYFVCSIISAVVVVAFDLTSVESLYRTE